MSPSEEIVHVSDTALMVAACRAMETARPDGFVRDPFAERLAGERGMAIARAMPRMAVMCFGVGARSRFLDDLVTTSVRDLGIATVVSVGCGLDARPYRLDLPAGLRWIEVDFPAMLDYKAAALASDRPQCRLERLPADLSDPVQRHAVFAAASGAPGLMITEGLLEYLPARAVEGLAAEAPSESGIRYWLANITSPAMARIVSMGTWRNIQNVRAQDHLDGDGILEALGRHGWASIRRRSFITDMEFAAGRLRTMMALRPDGSLPPAPLPAEDPSGVHLFGRA